ncbi:MAG TPA: VWA domain-containing protein [Acidobacteriaceae bacterium]|nr:VWA domain-containing protein [Acidobacteriaceae bacterium]
MNRGRWWWVVLACSGMSLWAQQPATAPAGHPASPATTMTFDVMVTDKGGHAVTGLQQSDFTVLDDKHPATIESFTAHAEGSENSLEGAVIVIDTVNVGFSAVSIARTQLEDLLRHYGNHLPFPMVLTLLTNTGVKPIGTGSADGTVLLAQLDQQKGLLRELNRSAGFWGATELLSTSINGLESIAQFEATTPGRKLVIWISPGWPILDSPNLIVTDQQHRAMFEQIVKLSEDLRTGQATVYDVDPLGTADAGGYRTFLWESFVKPVTKWDQANPGNLALQALAIQSGGQVLNSSNDVAGEIDKCVQDGTAWYTVTFDGGTAEKPDTWHNVQIKVDKPGVTVRTRIGYYAQP